MALYEAACAYFFKKPQWSPPADQFAGHGADIAVGGCVDPVLTAVLKAYSIENDDRQMRKIITLPKEEQPGYFDKLRKNYPKRYEFPHFNVKAGGCPAGVVEKLKGLGFGVES